ncbi:MAG: hypothetical protein ACXWZB_01125 [Gaiellaceae bacterium]
MSTRRVLLSMGTVIAAIGVWAAPAMAAPPANTTPPTITGTPRVGETLTAQNGTWANNPTAFRYQWQRCSASGAACIEVPGAVEKTYLVTHAENGRTLRAVVIASNIEGVSSARSAQTAVIAPSDAARNTSRPTITGEPIVASQLTANEGTWTNSPTSYVYRWLRCDVDGLNCSPIELGQAKNYQVRPADIGSRLRVRVIAVNPSGSGAAVSLPTGFVTPSTPITTKRPVLTLLSVRITGNRVYARFRICDDIARNLTIIATDAKPQRGSQTRRFSTLIPPNPCGVYTRSWIPAKKFRIKGRYTVTIQVRDYQGLTSAPARRSFNLR